MAVPLAQAAPVGLERTSGTGSYRPTPWPRSQQVGWLHAITLPTKGQVAEARSFARARHGLVSFAVVDSSGTPYCYACRRHYPSASLVKAMLLVAYLKLLAAEGHPLTEADRALLAPMIRRSDNVSATAIYRRVGDARLYQVAKLAGMWDFEVSGYWGSAYVTAADQARFFAHLNRLTPKRFRPYARSLLSSVVPWQAWGIPEVSRLRWRSFFKGGWMPTAGGYLVHQGARLERPGLSVAIAVLTDENPSHSYGRETIRGIAVRLLAPELWPRFPMSDESCAATGVALGRERDILKPASADDGWCPNRDSLRRIRDG